LENLANSKTKQAIDKLLHLLKGRGAVSLEEMYTLCGCGYDALAGALSSLIEREGIRIGRIKTRRGWLVDINEGPASPQSGIVWYSERGQLRKILPKLLKELKKYTRTEEESPEYRDNGEIIKTITHLLSDGQSSILSINCLGSCLERHSPLACRPQQATGLVYRTFNS
jgi:hypothetical protein